MEMELGVASRWAFQFKEAGLGQSNIGIALSVLPHRIANLDDYQEFVALIASIMRDKARGNAVPRKTYVAILELLTPPKPRVDPQAQLVATYRRKLSMALG